MQAPDNAKQIGFCEFMDEEGHNVEPTEMDNPAVACNCGWKGTLSDLLCVVTGDDSPAWCPQCRELMDLTFLGCP